MFWDVVFSMLNKRLHTFDIVRAIAIILMILAHAHAAWLDPTSKWLEGLLYCILSPMGVPGFVFVSGMGFGFSWNNRKRKGFNYRQNMEYQLPRTIALFIVAMIYNIVAMIIHWDGLKASGTYPSFTGEWGVIFNFWFWYILQTLAVSRFFGMFFMKFGKITRMAIGIAIIFLNPILLNNLEVLEGTNAFASGLYWFLYNPVDTDSIVMYFPLFLAGSVIGQVIFDFANPKNVLNNRENNIQASDIKKPDLDWKSFKILLIFGAILFIAGILSGLQGLTSSDTRWAWTTEFSTHPDWNITKTPMFLVKNEYPWLLYSLGWEIILTVLIFYFIDFKAKKPKTKPIELYGKYSFTIYISHYICYLIPLELSYKTIILGFIIFMLILYVFIHLIDTKGKGIYSLEYLMGASAKLIYKQMMHKKSKK